MHLAFGERALLADDMGLGKTIQAIAACELLARTQGDRAGAGRLPRLRSRRSGRSRSRASPAARAALVVRPARPERLAALREPAFFTIVNYEQVLSDADDINAHPEARHRRARRGAAHQELADQDRAAGQVAALALRLRADRHAGREPHRRDSIPSSSISTRRCSGRCSASIAISTNSTSAAAPSTTRTSLNCARASRRVMLRRRKADVETRAAGPHRQDLSSCRWPTSSASATTTTRQRRASLPIAQRRPLRQQEFERLQQCARLHAHDLRHAGDPRSRPAASAPSSRSSRAFWRPARGARRARSSSSPNGSGCWTLVRELASEMGCETPGTPARCRRTGGAPRSSASSAIPPAGCSCRPTAAASGSTCRSRAR